MVDERTGLTKTNGKTGKEVFRSAKYGSTSDEKVRVFDTLQGTKHKYRKLKFLRKLWRWKSVKKNKEELLEEGPNIEQQNVTLVTYAFCFIMMLAGLSVKIK